MPAARSPISRNKAHSARANKPGLLSFHPPHRRANFVEMNTITLKEVLEQMDSGNPFEIGFFTADKKRGTGGEFKLVKKAFKSQYLTPEQQIAAAPTQPGARRRCNPRHFQNSTRNIVRASNQDTLTVHIRLIRRFNGKTVL